MFWLTLGVNHKGQLSVTRISSISETCRKSPVSSYGEHAGDARTVLTELTCADYRPDSARTDRHEHGMEGVLRFRAFPKFSDALRH
jgi:hypothetical protein